MPPRPERHPLALFSLVPLNERADAVLAHQSNEHLLSYLKTGELALDIGHVCPLSGENTTLATLGRNGDVIVEGSSIAKIQCSFEIDLDTRIVMFYDRSHNQTSQVAGCHAKPFEYGRPRKVVVQEKVNTIIGLGGVRRNLVQFELRWPCDVDEVTKGKNRENAFLEENPRFARTIDETNTVPPSRMETRIHTPGPQPPSIRYVTDDEGLLGEGQFGTVHKAVNVDTGKLMADHIVEYITSQGWDGPQVEIFMGLKDGTLESLIQSECSVPIPTLAEIVLHHILQAIDCLATQGIIHRDVKPENILHTSRQGNYHFQLGDFGLSNRQTIATTHSGTPLYMAPEIFQNGKQTHKVDVWSLFVTIIWTLNIQGFREASNGFGSYEDVQRMVLALAITSQVVSIQEMARINPDERASAAQMLIKCFGGKGLVTHPNRVPPLVTPEQADKTPAAPGPSSTRPAQLKPRNLRKKAKTNIAASQFRVEKAWFPGGRSGQIIDLGFNKGQGPSNCQIPGGFPDHDADTS